MNGDRHGCPGSHDPPHTTFQTPHRLSALHSAEAELCGTSGALHRLKATTNYNLVLQLVVEVAGAAVFPSTSRSRSLLDAVNIAFAAKNGSKGLLIEHLDVIDRELLKHFFSICSKNNHHTTIEFSVVVGTSSPFKRSPVTRASLINLPHRAEHESDLHCRLLCYHGRCDENKAEAVEWESQRRYLIPMYHDSVERRTSSPSPTRHAQYVC